MDLSAKLAVLADAAKYDASCASSGTNKRHSRDGQGLGSTSQAQSLPEDEHHDFLEGTG